MAIQHKTTNAPLLSSTPPMLLLPTAEERDWLAHSLRKLFAQHDRTLRHPNGRVVPGDL
jgi:hypothetical protein